MSQVVRLDDVSFLEVDLPSISVDESISKLAGFSRQYPSFWEKLILIGMKPLDLHQVSRHEVLSGNLFYSRKLTNFLVRLQLGEEIWRYSHIVPGYIVVFAEFLACLPIFNSSIVILLPFFKHKIMIQLGYLPDNIILCAVDIHDRPAVSPLLAFKLPLHGHHLLL